MKVRFITGLIHDSELYEVQTSVMSSFLQSRDTLMRMGTHTNFITIVKRMKVENRVPFDDMIEDFRRFYVSMVEMDEGGVVRLTLKRNKRGRQRKINAQ